MSAQRFSLTLLGSMLALACAKSPPPSGALSDADRSAIALSRDSLLATLNRGDIGTHFAWLSADHVTAPPNEPALPVGDRLRAWHQKVLDQGSVRLTVSPPDLTGAGNLAVDRWQYTFSVQPKAGGAAAEDRGKGVWIWRREADGTWKLAYSLWNSDIPTPTIK